MNQKQIASLEKHIASDYDNLAGMVILQNGKTVYEHYFHACDAANRFHVYSVTKSILSILIGIALDKGYIKNIDQKVLDFFPVLAECGFFRIQVVPRTFVSSP